MFGVLVFWCFGVWYLVFGVWCLVCRSWSSGVAYISQYIYIYMYVCMCMCVCVYIHIYIITCCSQSDIVHHMNVLTNNARFSNNNTCSMIDRTTRADYCACIYIYIFIYVYICICTCGMCMCICDICIRTCMCVWYVCVFGM